MTSIYPVFKVSSSIKLCFKLSSSFTDLVSLFLSLSCCFDAFSSCSIGFLRSEVKFGELKAPPLFILSNKSTVMQIPVFKTIRLFVHDI